MFEETKKFRGFLEENSLVYDTLDIDKVEVTRVSFFKDFKFNFSSFEKGKSKMSYSMPQTADELIEFLEMVLD